MKRILALLALLALTPTSMAAPSPATIPQDSVQIGKSAAGDKTIILNKGSGSANPKLKWNNTSGKLQFSNDGTNFKDFGSGSGGGAGINFLQDSNADFEQGTTSWTASGGSFTIDSSTNVFHDTKSAAFDASAGSQTLSSAAITISSSVAPGLKSSNGTAACWFKTAASDYKLQVYDGTNVLSEGTIPATSEFTKFPIGFAIPSSGSVRLRIISASDAAVIYADDCQLGSFSDVSISQASLVAAAYYPGTSNCSWSRTNTAVGDFGTDSDCVAPIVEASSGGVGVSTADADLPQLTLTNAPPAIYKVTTNFTVACGTNAQDWIYAISDGTTTSGQQYMNICSSSQNPPVTVIGYFTKTSASSSLTFKMQCGVTSGICHIQNSNSGQRLQFIVEKFPLSPETAFRADNIPASWSGRFGTDCVWSTSSTAAAPGAEFGNDASCTFTERTNRNFGTVSAYGSTKPGITFTPSRIGRYEVCAFFEGSIGNTGNIAKYWLVHGSTILADGSVEMSNRTQVALCGIADITSVSSQTIQVMGAVDNASFNNVIAGAASSSLNLTIKHIDQPMPAPILVGGVYSNTTGQERLERATINCANDGSSSVVSQSGSWISSIGNGGATGICQVNFAANIFSGTPSCQCTSSRPDSVADVSCHYIAGSASSSSIKFARRESGADDGELSILCMGPR